MQKLTAKFPASFSTCHNLFCRQTLLENLNGLLLLLCFMQQEPSLQHQNTFASYKYQYSEYFSEEAERIFFLCSSTTLIVKKCLPSSSYGCMACKHTKAKKSPHRSLAFILNKGCLSSSSDTFPSFSSKLQKEMTRLFNLLRGRNCCKLIKTLSLLENN